MARINHIAVIRLSAMGDVAMAVPALRALNFKYPDVKVTMVSRPMFAPLFEDIPNVSFFPVDLKRRHKGILGMYRLFKDLKDADAIADLHQVLRSKIVRTLFRLSGKRVASLDKMRQAKRALTRAEHKVFTPLPHVTQKYAEVFSTLGFPIDLDHLAVLPKRSLSSVSEFAGSKTGRWIGIAPFAAHPGKVYPPDLMQIVVDKLVKTDATLFLFGSKDEVPELESFAKNHQSIRIAAGKLNFQKELALISNLDVMLAMDSANAHLAAIFGVPTVTLWGATHPFTGFAPFGQPDENAITADREKFPLLPTSIYGNKVVPGYQDAMRTIAPDKVVEKIERASSSKP